MLLGNAAKLSAAKNAADYRNAFSFLWQRTGNAKRSNTAPCMTVWVMHSLFWSKPETRHITHQLSGYHYQTGYLRKYITCCSHAMSLKREKPVWTAQWRHSTRSILFAEFRRNMVQNLSARAHQISSPFFSVCKDFAGANDARRPPRQSSSIPSACLCWARSCRCKPRRPNAHACKNNLLAYMFVVRASRGNFALHDVIRYWLRWRCSVQTGHHAAQNSSGNRLWVSFPHEHITT